MLTEFCLKSMSYEKILDNLFPHYCVLCNSLTNRDLSICCDCEANLPKIDYSCKSCGQPFSNNRQVYCGECLQEKPPHDFTVALFHYQEPIDYLIQTLKFSNNLAYANVLGKLLAREIAMCYKNCSLPEAIIPVPLHKERLKERGFNQALEIARPISKELLIPLNHSCCGRVRNTEAQAMLGVEDRIPNVHNAFKCSKLPYKHVAIVDDVVTTGSTVRELSKALIKAGAKQVDVWTVARATSCNDSF